MPRGFAVSGAPKQISEPRRLAAESSPSLNGEGSTRTRVYQGSQPEGGFEPAHKRIVRSLTYSLHARNLESGLEYRGWPIHCYADRWPIDP